MWIPLRSAKMYGRILGFQRRVWWPKWTPASSSCRIETDGTGERPPVRFVPPRTSSPGAGLVALPPRCRHRPGRNGPRVISVAQRVRVALSHGGPGPRRSLAQGPCRTGAELRTPPSGGARIRGPLGSGSTTTRSKRSGSAGRSTRPGAGRRRAARTPLAQVALACGGRPSPPPARSRGGVATGPRRPRARRRTRVDRHEIELVATDMDVPGQDGPARLDQPVSDQRLGGVTRQLRRRASVEPAQVDPPPSPRRRRSPDDCEPCDMARRIGYVSLADARTTRTCPMQDRSVSVISNGRSMVSPAAGRTACRPEHHRVTISRNSSTAASG